MNPASSHAGVSISRATLSTDEQQQSKSRSGTTTLFTKNMQTIDTVLRERSPNYQNLHYNNISQNQDNLLRRVVSVEEPLPPIPLASPPQSYTQNTSTTTTAKSPSPPNVLFGSKEAVSPILSKTLFFPPTPQDENGLVHKGRTSSTVLCALILQEQYLEATRRVRDYPEEASTWVMHQMHGTGVSPTRKNNQIASPARHGENNDDTLADDDTYERLPIHIASQMLAFATDSNLRFQLEQLILRLVLIYPEGCSFEDNYNQRLPLHEAIWNNATPETISMLVMADPTSMYRKDTCGRNASEVNRHGCGVFVDQIKELLNMGLAFWEDARRKAADRFGNSQHSVKPQDVYHSAIKADRAFPSICFDPTSDAHAYDSSLTLDLESDSILSESFHSIYEFKSKITQTTPTQQHQQLQLYQQQQIKSDNNPSSCGLLAESNENHNISRQENSSSAKKADMRADILQSMLSEMYDKNHKLMSTIAELTQLNSTLLQQNTKQPEETIDTLIVRPNPPAPVSRPEEEAPRTKEQPKTDEIDKTASNAQTVFRNVNDYAVASMTEVFSLRAQNNALLQKVDRLNRRKKKQAEKISYLKGIVACTASEDILEDFSDVESASTYSWIDSISGTEATPLVVKSNLEISMLNDDDDDDCSSTGSSFHRRLKSTSSTRSSAVNDASARSCLITGLAGYRMKCFVSSLYKKVLTSKESTAQEDTADIPDTIDEICDLAADIYAEHVKECSWRTGGLVLQWEPEPRMGPNSLIPLQESGTSPKQTELTPSKAEEDSIEVNAILPAKHSLANHGASSELNDSVFCSETSLSSIGVQSLEDGYRWI